VGLERGSLSLVSTIEELLGRKSSRSALENREYGRKDPRDGHAKPLYPQKFALTSPTSGGLPVGIVRSRTRTCYSVQDVTLLLRYLWEEDISVSKCVRILTLRVNTSLPYWK
jgi:hypothetical protein